MQFLNFIVLFLFIIIDNCLSNQPPNIIVILADDLGWNDVSFHGSNQIPTPNIDALAYNGIILNNHYVQSLCTPSRAAFLTGKYPIHTGMQHIVILENEPWGLPLNEKLMPEYLREAGYATHAIGKWHLGFFQKEYTPTYRGFDTHFGYWNGLQDYYAHTVSVTHEPTIKGYDMRRNMSVDYDSAGQYSTHLFTNEAVQLIERHNTSQPMFMYLSHLAPHTGNADDPLQAPDSEIAKFSYIDDPERRIYAAMVSMLDESVGEVISALRSKRMLENSIIVFLADNGGQTFGIHANHGSNYPLRGMKGSAWEGGIRGVGAIWSPLLNRTQRVSNQMMHMSDWLPTFCTAAGLNITDKIDGVDMWSALANNDDDTTNPRTEFVVNIDDSYASVRKGDWKLVTGTANSNADGWYGERSIEHTELGADDRYSTESILYSKAGIALTGLTTMLQIQDKHNQKPNNKKSLLTSNKIEILRAKAQLKCPQTTINKELHCEPLQSPCLFNIKNDPCETINMATIRPLIFTSLQNHLTMYRKTVVDALNQPADPLANPIYWNNTWSNWLDPVDRHHKQFPVTTLSMLIVVVALFLIVLMILIVISLKGCSSSLNSNLTFSNVLNNLNDSNKNQTDVNVTNRTKCNQHLLTEFH